MKKVVCMLLLTLFLGGCGDQISSLAIKGDPGIAGKDGTNGQDGANGADGAPGEKGDKGDIGATGATGAKGDKGDAGTPGTTVEVVQLCGSCVGAYPNVFPEIGLCMNGKLYGVYSANDGFLVFLPNGAYHSKGINCECNLVISGCTVN